MALYLHNEPCPKCHIPGRNNTLARYSDGSAYCFYPCGHYEHSSLISHIKPTEEVKTNTIYLPTDTTTDIDIRGINWLNKYEINNREIKDNHIYWSPSKEMLIFPYFNDSGLIAWQGRCFNPNKTKWYSKGNLSTLLHILGTNNKGIVLCEDIVSTIKVSRIVKSCCLFGSNISSVFLQRLSLVHQGILYIWLDYDKKKELPKFYKRASQFEFIIHPILTVQDPKDYNTQEIEEILGYKTTIT